MNGGLFLGKQQLQLFQSAGFVFGRVLYLGQQPDRRGDCLHSQRWSGPALDASTGDFAGATVVPDPDHAWIVGSDVLDDVAGGQDLTHTNTLPTGSYSRNGNSLQN